MKNLLVALVITAQSAFAGGQCIGLELEDIYGNVQKITYKTLETLDVFNSESSGGVMKSVCYNGTPLMIKNIIDAMAIKTGIMNRDRDILPSYGYGGYILPSLFETIEEEDSVLVSANYIYPDNSGLVFDLEIKSCADIN